MQQKSISLGFLVVVVLGLVVSVIGVRTLAQGFMKILHSTLVALAVGSEKGREIYIYRGEREVGGRETQREENTDRREEQEQN